MRTQERAFYWAAVTSIITFAASLWLRSYPSPPDFWINILLGVFAGALLITVQSAISYRIERDAQLWKLYETAVHLLNRIDRTNAKIAGRTTDVVYLYDLVSDSVDYYFIQLSVSIKDVSFMVRRGKLETCVRAIDRDAHAVYGVLRKVHGYLDEVLKGSADFSLDDSRFKDWVSLQEGTAYSQLTDNVIVLRKLVSHK